MSDGRAPAGRAPIATGSYRGVRAGSHEQQAMKILLITTTYPTPARPRQGAFNGALVAALSARHDVRVIAPIPWTQSAPGTAQPADRTPIQYPAYYYPPKILRPYHHHFYWWSIQPALRSLEREFAPDIVMGYWLHPDGAAAVSVAQRYGVPAVVMSGGTDIRILTRERRRCRAIARVLGRADRLVVFSRELATQACRLGIPGDKVDVVYRGVQRECFCPVGQDESRRACGLPRDAVILLWAGRFEPVKDPALLLHAAVRWKREWGPALRVVMAGAGPLRRRLLQLRHQLGLHDTVVLAGDLTQCQLALHFCAADRTVLTSCSEGIPNVLLESIACGTPFVATDVGGIAEIASPGIDQLVPAGDVNALAETVIRSMRTEPAADRTFVPTDLSGMADQFDRVLARLSRGRAVTVRSPLGFTTAQRATAGTPTVQEPLR